MLQNLAAIAANKDELLHVNAKPYSVSFVLIAGLFLVLKCVCGRLSSWILCRLVYMLLIINNFINIIDKICLVTR